MPPLTCFDVAEYLLSKSEEEAGDAVSNLHLQKLVYYAQGFSLALNNRPLFNEPICAWQQGPVCVPLFEQYREHGSSGIPVPEHVDLSKFSKEDLALLDEVHEVYGQFAAWKLRDMVMHEDPWRDTEIREIIPWESMARFFKTRLRV